METRRIVVALLLALILSGGATYFVYTRLRGQSRSVQMKRVVISSKVLPAGGVLKAEDLSTADWPVSLPLTGTFSKVDEVVGRALVYPLERKNPSWSAISPRPGQAWD
ncbi:MAG: hypothetical protein LAO07_05200 [Acidobacteriia bacterium]|nr:hypothetical protein [Terriglobia bacterium]